MTDLKLAVLLSELEQAVRNLRAHVKESATERNDDEIRNDEISAYLGEGEAIANRTAAQEGLRTTTEKPETASIPPVAAASDTPKMAPVQGYSAGIPWDMHLRAYDAYCKHYGRQPALIDLEGRNCRGGFGADELDRFIPGWRKELSERTHLLEQVKAAEAKYADLKRSILDGSHPNLVLERDAREEARADARDYAESAYRNYQRSEAAEAKLHEVREIYTGMEGFVAETAPEGYQQCILRKMYEAAK